MTAYQDFMVFALSDTGERQVLEVTEEELSTILHPEQVFVIIKEDLRRIYIWKGAKSPVRKRFISSRVASALQEELVKQAAFHRCKIVSIDQGDEMEEFLRAFGLQSMEVEEKLEDMRYVRNIEKKGGDSLGKVIESSNANNSSGQEPYFSPALQELEKKSGAKVDLNSFGSASSPSIPSTKKTKEPSIERQPSPYSRPSYIPYPSGGSHKSSSEISEEEKKKIMEKILKTNIPTNCKRQNLIIGNLLYGAVTKKTEVFGKIVEETEWEPVKKVPKGMIQLEDHVLRAYFNEDKGIVEALEILTNIQEGKGSNESIQDSAMENNKEENKERTGEHDTSFNSWTVKELKQYAEENKIELPEKARKAEIIDIIESYKRESTPESNPTSIRRKLPEIPKE